MIKLTPTHIRNRFYDSLAEMEKNRRLYVKHPEKDFTRSGTYFLFCGLLSPLGFVFLFNLFIFSLLFFRRSAADYSLFMHSLAIWLNDIWTVLD